jgi:hypothetical protein
VEAWALVTGGSGTYRSAVTSRSTGTGATAGYILYASNSDRWEFWLGNGNTFTPVAGPPISENQWTHLVGTFDGTTAVLYVNGVLAGSATVAYMPNAQNRLSIGAGATETVAGDFFFPGRLDDVAVYPTALSSAQVQSHYAAAFPSTAPPRFTTQPLSRATLAGENFTLAGKIHSTLPVSYQWQLNGANVTGATNATLTLASVSAAQAGTYQLIASHGSNSSTNSPATLQVLSGEAVSVSIEGFENLRTIRTNGGYAGFVAVTNWNEVGYGLNSGSATNLVNNKGQASAISLAWSAANNRRWNGPFTVAKGDAAMLNGFIEATSGNDVLLSINGIPANYQAAGYWLYVYLGAPSATAGIVNPADSFGAVSAGGGTNYYHAIDLATWDGSYSAATTIDSFATPSDANYAVFNSLNAASVTVRVSAHPQQTGPASLSGFQLVANSLAPTPVPLSISQTGATLTLSWPGSWVLQKKSVLDNNPNSWTDVTTVSPYIVPSSLSDQQFFRLRSP